MNKEIEIDKIVKEISENRAKIIDDFGKLYLAGRWKDYFSKQKKIDFSRLELVEERKSPTETIYYFRVKKGRNENRKR